VILKATSNKTATLFGALVILCVRINKKISTATKRASTFTSFAMQLATSTQMRGTQNKGSVRVDQMIAAV
jgi:hypothetical protein